MTQHGDTAMYNTWTKLRNFAERGEVQVCTIGLAIYAFLIWVGVKTFQHHGWTLLDVLAAL